jgi:hypothetical protein
MSITHSCPKLRSLMFATALVVSAPTGLAQALSISFFASGPDAAAITPTVNAFRTDLPYCRGVHEISVRDAFIESVMNVAAAPSQRRR